MDPAMQEQLLQQLRDIQSPDPIGWWPFAIGWWILIIVAICTMIGLAIWQYRKYQADAYRRQAMVIADQCFSQYRQDSDVTSYLGEINQLLRRLIRQISQEERQAEVSGSAWVALLDKYGQDPLSEDARLALSEHVYQPEPDTEVAGLHQELALWIKHHRRTPGD